MLSLWQIKNDDDDDDDDHDDDDDDNGEGKIRFFTMKWFCLPAQAVVFEFLR